jgi:fructokinase
MTQYAFSLKQALQLPHLRVVPKDAVVLFGEVLADVFPDKTALGGAPFNVARNLKAFGQNPVLITCLGCDALGDEVLRVMSQNGMETLGVQRCDQYPTGRVQVHIKDGKHRFEILTSQAYDFINQATANPAVTSVDPVLIYFGTLAQRQEVSSQALMSLLHNIEAAKFLDINLRAPWYDEKTLRQSLHYADIMKLNADELAVLVEMFKLERGDPKGQVRELLNKFDISQAVVTCGEAGAWQIDRYGKMFQASVKKRVAFKLEDTVGAGDGFSAVYLLGTLLRWPMTAKLERANAFASAICEIRGAVPDHPNFYKPFCSEWDL